MLVLISLRSIICVFLLGTSSAAGFQTGERWVGVSIRGIFFIF